MGEVLSKAGVLICISVLGYALKKLHVLQAEDYRPLSKIIMNVTLPCAVITAFAEGYRAEPLLFIAVLFGFLGNVIMMGVGWFLSRNKRKEEKAFYMLNASGYNIGAFVMPFVQSFLSPFYGGRLHVRRGKCRYVHRRYICFPQQYPSSRGGEKGTRGILL